MSKSGCCNKTIVSDLINNGMSGHECVDVCINPQCGEPQFLTVLAPVVYDQLGINICRTFDLPDTIPTTYPTAVYASAEVIDIAFLTTGDSTVTVEPITSRPNCYEITLTNLSVTFAIKLYDCCKRLLGTVEVAGIIYLPPVTTDESYNEDTNPTSLVVNLFAPYGVVYTGGDIASPALNVIGFSTTNSQLEQGLNLMAIPKVIDLDIVDGTITVGLSLILNSIYFTHYQLPHNGKSVISKGSTSQTEGSLCLDFVKGNLLGRSIKPLESCDPLSEKQICELADITSCLNFNNQD
ncbi:MAG: hypothetical protein IKJ73_09390 [Lachnospiraceae bacterium]|nr:hypothetical protein [Lachnospiraceae bacterium]